MAEHWFYIRNGEERGPVLPLALKALADLGSLKPDDLVRSAETAEWIPARRLRGLFSESRGDAASAGAGSAAIESEPMISFLSAQKPWQVSIRQLLVATLFAAIACAIISPLVRNSRSVFDFKLHSALAVAAFFASAIFAVLTKKPNALYLGAAAAVATLAGGLPCAVIIAIYSAIWLLGRLLAPRTRSGIDPAIAIQRRQERIYKAAAVWCLVLLFIWGPIFFTPHGTGCRPMVQLPVSALIVTIVTAVGLFRAGQQFVPSANRRVKIMAVLAALAPISVFALLQWIILDVLKIFYES